MMMTLECMVREVWAVPRGDWVALGRDADVEGCGRKEEVATKEMPKLERRGVEEKRLKAWENSVMVWRDL